MATLYGTVTINGTTHHVRAEDKTLTIPIQLKAVVHAELIKIIERETGIQKPTHEPDGNMGYNLFELAADLAEFSDKIKPYTDTIKYQEKGYKI